MKRKYLRDMNYEEYAKVVTSSDHLMNIIREWENESVSCWLSDELGDIPHCLDYSLGSYGSYIHLRAYNDYWSNYTDILNWFDRLHWSLCVFYEDGTDEWYKVNFEKCSRYVNALVESSGWANIKDKDYDFMDKFVTNFVNKCFHMICENVEGCYDFVDADLVELAWDNNWFFDEFYVEDGILYEEKSYGKVSV